MQETEGLSINAIDRLQTVEAKVREERDRMNDIFLNWAAKYCEYSPFLDTGSNTHMKQLFFGHYENRRLVAKTKVLKVTRDYHEMKKEDETRKHFNPYAVRTIDDLKAMLRQRGLRTSGVKKDLMHRLLEDDRLKNKSTVKSIHDSYVVMMNDKQLHDVCVASGYSGFVNRDSMIEYLVKQRPTSDKMSDEHLAHLREVASTPDRRVHPQVRITTIGMIPEKFTGAGTRHLSCYQRISFVVMCRYY